MNNNYYQQQQYVQQQQQQMRSGGFAPNNAINVEEEDEDMVYEGTSQNGAFGGVPTQMQTAPTGPPKQPVLVRYEVAQNIFEVPDRYKLQYAIGQGAYGIVCSAIDAELNEKVAIKKVFNIFEHDHEFQKRILREIKILKHFEHENVSRKIFFING